MDHNKIEKKWQNIWENKKYFESLNNSEKEKYYILVEFPYPSGSGLHVGHIRSYTALDAMARVKRAQGYNVLFPMGWDAFGAPAEQYAIKNKVYPSVMVEKCIEIFKTQIKFLGLSFDWSREINTTDPNYYKWTQWQFLKFFEAGMAYKDEKEINWCPTCKTGLSNEDSSGGVCERCGSNTTKKLKNQWLLRMKDYAESLIKGLDDTDFEEKIKLAQINWIGKSEGIEINFKLKDTDDYLKVFTTRPDTLFGVTFMVMSPEHPYLKKYEKSIRNLDELKNYQNNSLAKSEIERTDNTKEKTGIKIEGLTAINPINNESIEIWVSDYVLINYGTGAIMAVPAHDARDYNYAKKYNIPIVPVIQQVTGEKRENEKQKTSIVAVLYDEEKDKYLTLNWGNLGGRLFIGGSVMVNETLEDCAIREIAEETGYTNIELIRKTMPISHHYYAYNKNQAYAVQMTGFLFKITNKQKSNLNLDVDEENNFEIELVSESIINQEITDQGHKTIFNNLINPSSYDGEGIMINSEFLNGIDNKEEAIAKITDYLVDNNIGKKTTNYRLQDWIFSRQRFWGEPVPMIDCPKCGWVAVKESDLPVILPDVESYEPTDNGESPLSRVEEWVNVLCPKCGGPAKRETDTMPNWAGSSWYWIRYMDADNNNEFASMEAMKYWGAVDYYNGGMEHVARHLLYARFWNQFLYDQGIVPIREPFKKRVAHGMILGADGEKMSKSKGNVVNPEEMLEYYGADALRTYEMFIGDYSKDALWDEFGLKGCRKFLDRVYRLKERVIKDQQYSASLEKIIHKTIKKVTNDLLTMNYNTAVSSLMILLNVYEKEKNITVADYRILIQLLNPIAPHITEEINEECNLGNVLADSPWPSYDENKIIDNEVTIGVQVNGKLRASILVNDDDNDETIKEKALAQDNVQKHLEGKEVIKIIVIPKKIVSIVIK